MLTWLLIAVGAYLAYQMYVEYTNPGTSIFANTSFGQMLGMSGINAGY